jgi:uncharacterized membrane protein YphA (DoxX/SURF4 family)
MVTAMPAIDPAVALLLASALAVIFAWSGATKLSDVEMFEGAVANYRLIPRRMEKSFAWVVPLCECAGAAGLLFPLTRAFAARALVLLLCLFTGAITINLMRGRTNIDCGCFGPALRQDLSAPLLVRNAVLIVLAALVARPTGERPLEWIDWVTIGFGAATMVMLYANANYALGNAPRTRALEAL